MQHLNGAARYRVFLQILESRQGIALVWLRVLTLVTAALHSGCAVQWKDSRSVTRSFGTVWVTVIPLAAGTRIQRQAIGLDLRFCGPEEGFSFGWNSISTTRPELHAVLPSELADDVYHHLTKLERRESEAGSDTDWFFAAEDVSDDATMVESSLIGVELVGRQGQLVNLTAGARRFRYLCGAAFLPGIVHIHSHGDGTPSQEIADMWILRNNVDSEKQNDPNAPGRGSP